MGSRDVLRGAGVIVALVALASPSACGYHPLYGGSSGRLHVKVVRSLVPDPVASDEVAAGVRDELARGGWLEAGEGYPRVEIEVLRADEASEGIAAVGGSPVARATAVGITARAWIARGAGAAPERDTGDLRAEDTVAVDRVGSASDPRADAFHHADALRAAARQLGRNLAERLLGAPGPSAEVASPGARSVLGSGPP